MKMMSPTCYETYQTLCRSLRAKGTRLGFLEMSSAAELALLIEEGDTERAAELAERLGLDVGELE
jgi:hypothetical protein